MNTLLYRKTYKDPGKVLPCYMQKIAKESNRNTGDLIENWKSK